MDIKGWQTISSAWTKPLAKSAVEEAPTTPLIVIFVIFCLVRIMVLMMVHLMMMKTGMEGEKVMVTPDSRRRKEATRMEIFRPNLNPHMMTFYGLGRLPKKKP